MHVVVIDPGHGGTKKIGGSSSNNAKSPSGALEKNICLDIARRLRFSLEAGSAAKYAKEKGVDLKVLMTRDSDRNLGLSDRASLAATSDASLYLSIHCNGFDRKVRGTECWIDRKYMKPVYTIEPGKKTPRPGPGVPSSGLRNLNVDADANFAKAIVDAAVSALSVFDPKAKLRTSRYTRDRHGEAYIPPAGVKMRTLGTLRDAKLGTKRNDCRAALLEVEFIDNPNVDKLLNGASSTDVRNRLASDVGMAIVDQLLV